MTTGTLFLFLAAFLACAVEMVEALTIVIAVGVTRSWRSALYGVAVAFLALGVIVALLGPALTALPINVLRVVVGSLLLVFGLQWLRKAILRAGGYKALHDEDAIFRQEVAEARAAGALERERLDWYSFTLAFKGVFLEGLEVAFIVLAFGSAHHRGIALASLAAGAGPARRGGGGPAGPRSSQPRSGERDEVHGRRAPDHLRHVLVGGGRGRVLAGRRDGAGRHPRGDARQLPGAGRGLETDGPVRALRRFARFWYDFIVGDDWRIAIGVIVALGATAALAHRGYDVWWLMPIAVIGLLAYSIARIARS